MAFFVRVTLGPWGAMTSGDGLALLGDGLVLVGLVLTFVIYRRERRALAERDVASVLAMLEAVRDGIRPWGDLYFGTGYDDERAAVRAHLDFESIMKGSYGQIFLVPTEPLTALVERPRGAGSSNERPLRPPTWLCGRSASSTNSSSSRPTSTLVTWRQFYDEIPLARREALAKAAQAVSTMIHAKGIRDVAWYRALTDALESNIASLRGTE